MLVTALFEYGRTKPIDGAVPELTRIFVAILVAVLTESAPQSLLELALVHVAVLVDESAMAVDLTSGKRALVQIATFEVLLSFAVLLSILKVALVDALGLNLDTWPMALTLVHIAAVKALIPEFENALESGIVARFDQLFNVRIIPDGVQLRLADLHRVHAIQLVISHRVVS